jgi:hypothetical protein
MICGIDLGCYVAGWFSPVVAFWQAWDWLCWFVAGLIIGGVLGWRVVPAVLALGIGYFLYDRTRRHAEPDYETGEGNMHDLHNTPTPKPKKRRTLQDIFGGGR